MDDQLREALPYLRPRTGDLGWLGQLAAAAIVALVLGALATYVYTVWRARHRARRAFYAAGLERRLSKRQIRFLLDAARRQRMRQPLLLLTSLKTFDRCAGRLVADGIADAELELIDGARQRLGFDRPPPDQRFYTTRTLAPGQKLMVWPHGAEGGFLQCVVADRDERAITAVPLLREGDRLLSELEAGAAIKVRFWRNGDTEYRFRTRILEVDERSTSIRIAHAEKLERVQLRDYYRVQIDIPLHLYVLPVGVEHVATDAVVDIAETRVEAHTMDVSGGGMSVHLRAAIGRHREVVVDPELDGPLPLAGAQALVVDQQRQGDGWRVRLQFADMPSAARDDLVAAVFAHELRHALT